MSRRVFSSGFLALALAAVIVIIYAACAAAVDPSKPFVTLTREPLTSCDPAVVVDGTAEQLHGTAYEGLLKYEDGSAKLEPCLAVSYEVSEDGLIYSFKLREGVKFHDGTDFNAEAVVYSYERVKALNLGVASYLKGFGRAVADGEYQVSLIIEAPNSSFIYGVPWVKIISPTAAKAHEVEGDWAQAWLHEQMVGTGPYMFDRWDPATELVLKRFSDYWGGWEGKHLESIIFKVVAEPATQRMLLEAGDADMIDQVLISDIDIINAKPDLVYNESRVLGTWQIMMNTERPPLSDIRVRKTMSYAFDYEGMLNDVMEGHAFPAHGPIDPELPEHDNSILVYHKDLDKAKELLAEAGYPDGGFTLTFAVVQSLQLEISAGLMFQADLAKLGINLQIQELAWASMLSNCRDCESGPDMCFLGIGARVPDPNVTFARGWHTGGTYDWSCYANPELDAVLDEALCTVDPDKRTELYREAQRMIDDANPAIWVMASSQQNAMRAWVHGYKMNPADEFLTNFYTMWIE